MSTAYHLYVEVGPDRGKRFDVPARGSSLGRSSQNDIALMDEQLSRLHCRFQFRDGELWVTDLASANGTEVDGTEVTESRLAPGAKIRVGDTTLRVEKDDASVPPVVPVPAATGSVEGTSPVIRLSEDPVEVAPSGVAVDLGLADAGEEPSHPERNLKRTLLWSLATFVGLLALAVVVQKILEAPVSEPGVKPLAGQEAPQSLELRYEKTEGSDGNIFRYELALDADGKLSVSIDDLSQSRHVRKESPGPVAEDLLRDLARQVEQSGFFSLDPAYEGIGLPNTLVSYDLTVILGNDVRRVRVVNRNEPDIFRAVRERIETFVRNELGLWAVEFSKERLEQMANEAYLLGEKLVREKDIQAGNLFSATRSFHECVNLLETVEPKPVFFGQALASLRDANEELDRRYTDQNFRADRAIKLKDWDIAATELRVLLDLVPDRADDRYRDAERRLLDVESRLKDRRKP